MCAGHSKQGLSDTSDLKNPDEQAGRNREGQHWGQPSPTTVNHSNPWPWGPTQVTKPLWVCILTRTASSDERMHGQYPALTGHSGNASSSCSKPLHPSPPALAGSTTALSRAFKAHVSLFSFLRVPSHTWLRTGQGTPHLLESVRTSPTGPHLDFGLPRAITVSSSRFVW